MQPVQTPTSIQSQPASESAPPRTVSAVILAGRLRQAPLQESLDLHMLCLPVRRKGTLLEAWLDALSSVPNLAHIRVVVNSEEDATAVGSVLPREHRLASSKPRCEVMAEPASWRGAGGMVRDVTEQLPDDALVLVCEGTRLPPASFDRLLHAAIAADAEGSTPSGVVGVVGDDAPAGVYAFRRRCIRLAPAIGYYDLKEQFLPALAKAGERVIVAPLGEECARLRDLDSYLQTVRHSLQVNGDSPVGAQAGAADHVPSMLRVSARASVSGSAVLDGFCIIEPGAVIEDGAVVHDSVVLWGATVGGGAIVSCSVIGPLASVEARTRAVRQIVARR